MPSHYAHYRLGRQVRLELAPDAAEVVGRWPSLYLIGLHGPDILFYYRGYRENPVNRLGYALHSETGEVFVRWAAQVIAAHPGQDAHRAYAYGVLCHFALDESCHGIVARQMAAHGVSHVGLEAEFDRYLMLKDGLDPVRQPLTRHIQPELKNAHIIRDFYPGLTTLQVQEALRWMKGIDQLFLAPGSAKRAALYGGLKAAGKYDALSGLVIGYAPDPACTEGVEQLAEGYRTARALAVRLIAQFDTLAREGSRAEPALAFNFESKLPVIG